MLLPLQPASESASTHLYIISLVWHWLMCRPTALMILMAMIIICAAFLRSMTHDCVPYCVNYLNLIGISLLPLGILCNQPCWLAKACQLTSSSDCSALCHWSCGELRQSACSICVTHHLGCMEVSMRELPINFETLDCRQHISPSLTASYIDESHMSHHKSHVCSQLYEQFMTCINSICNTYAFQCCLQAKWVWS